MTRDGRFCCINQIVRPVVTTVLDDLLTGVLNDNHVFNVVFRVCQLSGYRRTQLRCHFRSDRILSR